MVKSIIYTVVAILLCLGVFFGAQYYIHNQFTKFNEALDTLYDKIENKEANREDAYAVKKMWADKKSRLHIFIPHNDISYIDYWLSEACALIYCGDFDAALGKVQVLRNISESIPGGYALRFENVF